MKQGEGVGAAGYADDQGMGGTGQAMIKEELADTGLKGRDSRIASGNGRTSSVPVSLTPINGAYRSRKEGRGRH